MTLLRRYAASPLCVLLLLLLISGGKAQNDLTIGLLLSAGKPYTDAKLVCEKAKDDMQKQQKLLQNVQIQHVLQLYIIGLQRCLLFVTGYEAVVLQKNVQ